ncbi:unnamed protein product [Pleuronectes platessa]|uniref:Uncharacterized protein n=1 Tax=Pleuronectes platessa TaxID=8262 RepID=A0A9N7UCF5_PLEPL|nr:unnamed protein product [Pleuronectes platessa]
MALALFARSYTHMHTLWKRPEGVFVVGRELSCHCTRELLMGNMKPEWGKPPDLSFGPDRLKPGPDLAREMKDYLDLVLCPDNAKTLAARDPSLPPEASNGARRTARRKTAPQKLQGADCYPESKAGSSFIRSFTTEAVSGRSLEKTQDYGIVPTHDACGAHGVNRTPQ